MNASAVDPSPPGTPASPDPWASLAAARTAEQLCVAWLRVLGETLVPCKAALLLMQQPDGAYAPVAALPADRELGHLRETATKALQARVVQVISDDLGHVQLGYPLLHESGVLGAVVLELGLPASGQVATAVRLVHWGSGWLLGLLQQRELAAQQRRSRQGGLLLDVVLGLQAEAGSRAAALALVNRVAQEFGCVLVQLALLPGPRSGTLRHEALSHAAWFEQKSGLLRRALAAMHEALDQRRTIAWPEAVGDEASGQPADAGLAALAVSSEHHRYADEAGVVALLSLPLLHDARPCGVLMLERAQPFGADERAHLEALALAVTPLLELQHAAEAGAARRLMRSAAQAAAWAAGPRHAAAKLGAGLLALVLVLLGVVPAPFRISAHAVVEGAVQRAAVAPFEGFLREAPARAGHLVKAGQVLAVLDDRDLKLERVRWESELEVAVRKEREAMAAGNAVDQRLALAQAEQARAQLDLAVSKLERAVITAPFDGTVVKGDLSQQLGTPVETGKVLFELAPLDAWRVVLKVDERDISHVKVGAQGELVLASLPGQAWPFTVRQLTPVSVAEDGRNHFRVEAELGQGAPRLSPNMEGVGKIEAGRASLLWNWTRSLRDWARQAWWQLLP
jgi:multidrug efflux pump subunit AcrA (membrane-fusion protein)